MDGVVRYVQSIIESFDTLDYNVEKEQKLPSARILEEVCATLLCVSCLRDEDRFPSFRVCFIGPDSELLGTYLYSHPLLFDQPISFTVPEIHKLAPALNVDMSFLMLDVSRLPIRIIGIIASYTAWKRIQIGMSTTGNRMPRIPNIAVNGPGVMDACFGESCVVSYKAGNIIHYRTDTFQSTLIAEKLREGSTVSDENRLRLIYRVIHRVREYRHGGLIFFVPSEKDCAENLDIKYRMPSPFLFTQKGAGALSGWPLLKETSAYADLIAKFTTVDGAVILTKNCDLVGFGAEIIADMSVRKPPDMCFLNHDNTENTERHFRENGMRHRAAYRFCEAVDGAVAIVFSQDDSIKACTKHKGRVVVYDHIALPLS